MKFFSVATIIILVLVLAIVLGIIFLVFYIKNKIERLSNTIFGTKNIINGFKEQEIEFANTPKSLSGMDTVLIPKINKDFPSINIEELKSIAENAIILYYESLKSGKLKNIPKATTKLKNKIYQDIEASKHIKYSNINIHRTVLNSYDNKKGLCKIILQSSLEYQKETKNKKEKVQDRINVELIYIYEESQGNISLNCPNCGAPIKTLGIKDCPYCSSGIIEMLSKTWQIDDIYHK